MLLPDGLLLIVEEGRGAQVHEGLLQVLLVQLVILAEVVVELLYLVG